MLQYLQLALLLAPIFSGHSKHPFPSLEDYKKCLASPYISAVDLHIDSYVLVRIFGTNNDKLTGAMEDIVNVLVLQTQVMMRSGFSTISWNVCMNCAATAPSIAR